jgi:hypothetical protein
MLSIFWCLRRSQTCSLTARCLKMLTRDFTFCLCFAPGRPSNRFHIEYCLQQPSSQKFPIGLMFGKDSWKCSMSLCNIRCARSTQSPIGWLNFSQARNTT